MSYPTQTNRMKHFDSSDAVAKPSAPGLTAHFSERVRFAMETDESTEGKSKDGPVKPVTAETPDDSDRKDDSSNPGGEQEEKTAPEPTKKTPQQMNESPRQAMYGVDGKEDAEKEFGPEERNID